jgi:16S rRNA processing protein RimM
MARGARQDEALVCLGQIGAPHGVRGEVRLRSFTAEPEAIAAYGPLQTEDGRAIEIETLRPAKDHFVAALAGIHDRDAAAQLANVKLYAPRERLPQLADPEEFYYADLIGLAVVDPSGERIGSVVAIHNFGAGDLLDVQLDASGRSELLPFNDSNVPKVDIAAGTIVIDPPADWLSPAPDAGEPDEAAPRSGKRSG